MGSTGSHDLAWASTSRHSNAQPGTITVPSTPESITANYKVTYIYTFAEEGLPSGTAWSVTANGQTSSATAPNEITFVFDQTSVSFTTYNASYNGVTYVPSPNSGTAYPGTTTITYAAYIPVNGTSSEIIATYASFVPLIWLFKGLLWVFSLPLFAVLLRLETFINALLTHSTVGKEK